MYQKLCSILLVVVIELLVSKCHISFYADCTHCFFTIIYISELIKSIAMITSVKNVWNSYQALDNAIYIAIVTIIYQPFLYLIILAVFLLIAILVLLNLSHLFLKFIHLILQFAYLMLNHLVFIFSISSNFLVHLYHLILSSHLLLHF